MTGRFRSLVVETPGSFVFCKAPHPSLSSPLSSHSALCISIRHSSAADIWSAGKKKKVQETWTPLTWKEEKWTDDGQYLVLFLEFV